MHLDLYKDLVYEFYISLSASMDENGNMIGHIMIFRMRGNDYEVMSEKFTLWLNCDSKGILNTTLGWTSNFLWHDLNGIGP